MILHHHEEKRLCHIKASADIDLNLSLPRSKWMFVLNESHGDIHKPKRRLHIHKYAWKPPTIMAVKIHLAVDN